MQKRTLRDGKKTISDLQAYLETNSKYKAEYGKESLKKYRKLIFQAEMAKKTAGLKPYTQRLKEKEFKKSEDRYTDRTLRTERTDKTERSERNAFSN